MEHDAIPYEFDFRTVIDAGANRGQFAVVAVRRFPRAECWCFEPLAAPRAKLEKVLRGHPALKVFDLALAAEPGEARMHISHADDSSSLRPIAKRQESEFPGTEAVGSTMVSVARLDEILALESVQAPCLLKVDVQGAELDVLRGANAVFTAFDMIVVECSFVELYVGQPLAPEIIAHLMGHGLTLTGVYNPVYSVDNCCLQADLLFERTATGPVARADSEVV